MKKFIILVVIILSAMLFYASGKTDYDRFLKFGKELRSVN